MVPPWELAPVRPEAPWQQHSWPAEQPQPWLPRLQAWRLSALAGQVTLPIWWVAQQVAASRVVVLRRLMAA